MKDMIGRTSRAPLAWCRERTAKNEKTKLRKSSCRRQPPPDPCWSRRKPCSAAVTQEAATSGRGSGNGQDRPNQKRWGTCEAKSEPYSSPSAALTGSSSPTVLESPTAGHPSPSPPSPVSRCPVLRLLSTSPVLPLWLTPGPRCVAVRLVGFALPAPVGEVMLSSLLSPPSASPLVPRHPLPPSASGVGTLGRANVAPVPAVLMSPSDSPLSAPFFAVNNAFFCTSKPLLVRAGVSNVDFPSLAVFGDLLLLSMGLVFLPVLLLLLLLLLVLLLQTEADSFSPPFDAAGFPSTIFLGARLPSASLSSGASLLHPLGAPLLHSLGA